MDRFRNTRQPDWDWWGRLWPTPGETLRDLGVAPGHTLADIGSGNGYFALPAARITHPAPVYALDLDESLLDELASVAGLQGVDNVRAVHGDARSLAGHLPERVDSALVANVLHGVEEPGRFVGEVFDSIEPGGRVAVVNWQDRPSEETTVMDEPRGPPADLRLSPGETERVVRAASDADPVRRVELPPYHYGLVFGQ